MSKEILVVEDEPGIRDILNYVLTNAGYRVTTAKNALDFFQIIENHHPELILLDVMLPDGNGLELSKAIKTNPKTSHIPVIIVSAHTSVAEVFEESGADDFIRKPFDIDNLIWTVEKQLRENV